MADEHGHGSKIYLIIFGILLLFTLLSFIADVIEIEQKALLYIVVLGIACMKAMCVMMYFMHLKFEGKWKYAILLPTTVLALAIPFALAPDIGVHYYDVEVPQYNSLLIEEQKSPANKHSADHGHQDEEAAEHGGAH